MLKRWLIFCLLSLSNVIYAGNGTSGGGGAFVCRDSQKNILNSELLDLWEAKYLNRLTIDKSNEGIETQIERAFSNLDKFHTPYLDTIKEELEIILNKAIALPKGVTIKAPTDANNNYEKPGCPLEGMMFYDGDLDHVVYNPETYNYLLSNTDKAAVWAHEAIYKVLRDRFNETDSKNTRKLVGCLFSNDCESKYSLMTIEELLKNDPSPMKVICEDGDTTIYVTGSNTNKYGNFIALHTYYTKLDNINLKYPAYETKYDPETNSWLGGLFLQGLENNGLQLAKGTSQINTISYRLENNKMLWRPSSIRHNYYYNSNSTRSREVKCKQVNL